MTRKIKSIYIHCSASNSPLHDHVDVIRQWHLERGWSTIGYNFFITSHGRIQFGRKISLIPAHVKGHNSNSIGICLSGRDNFTEHQIDRAVELVNFLLDSYGLTIDDVFGHYEIDNKKTCPNVSMITFRAKLKELENGIR